MRTHAGTAQHVNIFGYFYNIDSRELTEVVRDRAEVALRATLEVSSGAAS